MKFLRIAWTVSGRMVCRCFMPVSFVILLMLSDPLMSFGADSSSQAHQENTNKDKKTEIDRLKKTIASHVNDTIAIRALYNVGKDYAGLSNDSSLRYFNKAAEIAKIRPDKFLLKEIYWGLTELFLNSRNPALAIDYCFQLLKIIDSEAMKGRDSVKIAKNYQTLYSEIGLCYFNLNNSAKALIYFNKSLSIIEHFRKHMTEKEYLEKKLAMVVNIGSVYLENKSFKESRTYFERALDLNHSLENQKYYSALYNNIGIIYKEQKQYDLAFRYYNRALTIRESLNDTAGIAQVLNNMGQCYFWVKDYSKAESCLKRSLTLSEKTGNVRSVMFASQFLSIVYEETNRYKDALELYKQYKDSYDSIINTEATANSTRLETQYEYEKQLKENELEQQLLISRKEHKALIYMVIAGVLLFMFIIAILLMRNQRIRMRQSELSRKSLELESLNLNLEKHNLELKNENLEMELNFKKKELATQVMYLLQKNELIATTIKEIQDLKTSGSEEQTNALHSIIRDMKSNLDRGAWDEFELRFQQVHQDFYDKLNGLHPDLTPNEVKLSAFLRLNMTTKEISSITYQTPKSIQVARTRLRKKIGIERDENLASYLQQL